MFAPRVPFMKKPPVQNDLNYAMADFLLHLEARVAALEITVAQTLHPNLEQREAFHQKIEERLRVFYEKRLKHSAKLEAKLAANSQPKKKRAKKREE